MREGSKMTNDIQLNALIIAYLGVSGLLVAVAPSKLRLFGAAVDVGGCISQSAASFAS